MELPRDENPALQLATDMEQAEVVLRPSMFQMLPQVAVAVAVATAMFLAALPKLATWGPEAQFMSAYLWWIVCFGVAMGGGEVLAKAQEVRLRVRDNAILLEPRYRWLRSARHARRLRGLDEDAPVAVREDFGVVLLVLADGSELRILSGANQPSVRTQVVSLLQQAIDARRAYEAEELGQEPIREQARRARSGGARRRRDPGQNAGT